MVLRFAFRLGFRCWPIAHTLALKRLLILGEYQDSAPIFEGLPGLVFSLWAPRRTLGSDRWGLGIGIRIESPLGGMGRDLAIGGVLWRDRPRFQRRPDCASCSNISRRESRPARKGGFFWDSLGLLGLLVGNQSPNAGK